MALTRSGDELTQAHKHEQIRLAAEAAGESDVLWAELNPGDPYPWAYAQALLLADRKDQSTRLASAYLSEFAGVETGRPAQIVEPAQDFDRLIGVSIGAGANAVTNLVDEGVRMDVALDQMRERFNEIVAAETQRTYREMIADTAGTQRKTWRRVTDGDPCSFCAMLASRGPVYQESTVTASKYALRYHKGCGCTAEPWYGQWSDWKPTSQEQKYVDAYFEAAAGADADDQSRVAPKTIRDADGVITGRTEDNILWRMRRANPDLFSDGVYVKAA